MVVEDAMTYQFVFHALLALSAQHLAGQLGMHDKRRATYERAYRHHLNDALEDYLPLVSLVQKFSLERENSTIYKENELTQERARALSGPIFATSLLLAFMNLAGNSDNALGLPFDPENELKVTLTTPSGVHSPLPDLVDEHLLAARFENILSLFKAVRGTYAVTQIQRRNQFLGEESPYRGLTGRFGHPRDGIFPLPPLPARVVTWYATLKLKCMEELIPGHMDYDMDDGMENNKTTEWQICINALTQLEVAHHNALLLDPNISTEDDDAKATGLEPGWFLKWVAEVSPQYIELLRARHAAALVVLAQFTALVDLARERWFLKNWVHNTLDAIHHVVEGGPGTVWVQRIQQRYKDEDWTKPLKSEKRN